MKATDNRRLGWPVLARSGAKLDTPPVEAVLLPRTGQAFWNALLIGQMPV
jgi:hypothetical protein